MEIPVKVRQAAQYLVKMYGDHLEHSDSTMVQRLFITISLMM